MKKFNDLEFKAHKSIKTATASYIEFTNGEWISVIGCLEGNFYGNGITSFEVMSSSTEKTQRGVKGWLSKAQITRHMIYLQKK
jgi:hypothetical protein